MGGPPAAHRVGFHKIQRGWGGLLRKGILKAGGAARGMGIRGVFGRYGEMVGGAGRWGRVGDGMYGIDNQVFHPIPYNLVVLER
jgi:hypothetical protein